ncbi:hypothetical protein J2S00_003923 [Caldalkalibacillus uzonensis]|uniref:Uncharacterized protein n=1 Tax=Caldalkalibacillus uzonensis TaxID=353224 RepID=A0ABU0CY67_9BACI|nr:hypothetical protein [Caldalkalibacillus uzonensis]
MYKYYLCAKRTSDEWPELTPEMEEFSMEVYPHYPNTRVSYTSSQRNCVRSTIISDWSDSRWTKTKEKGSEVQFFFPFAIPFFSIAFISFFPFRRRFRRLFFF